MHSRSAGGLVANVWRSRRQAAVQSNAGGVSACADVSAYGSQLLLSREHRLKCLDTSCVLEDSNKDSGAMLGRFECWNWLLFSNTRRPSLWRIHKAWLTPGCSLQSQLVLTEPQNPSTLEALSLCLRGPGLVRLVQKVLRSHLIDGWMGTLVFKCSCLIFEMMELVSLRISFAIFQIEWKFISGKHGNIGVMSWTKITVGRHGA